MEAPIDAHGLDPYAFMALVGKRILHPGGRAATDALLAQARIEPRHAVLDAGCGVGTTAIRVAREHGAHVTAVDVDPLMLDNAERSVRAAGLGDRIVVRHGDVTSLPFPDGSFDRVIAEAVTMFVHRPSAAGELVRVCRPGGRILATEFAWRRPPSDEARVTFQGEVCPGMQFDTVDDWITLYRNAGMTDVEVVTGPFEMMTPRGFVADEGPRNTAAIMLRLISSPSYLRRMAWLWPRIRRAVPYLGFVLVSGTRPVEDAAR